MMVGGSAELHHHLHDLQLVKLQVLLTEPGDSVCMQTDHCPGSAL